MAIIKPVTLRDEGPQGELLRDNKDRVSGHPNFYGTLANSPAMFNGYLSAASALKTGVLPDELAVQIALVVSSELKSPYCLKAHKELAEKQGVSAHETDLNMSGISSNSRTGLILAFVRNLVQCYGNVKATEIELLRAQGVTDEEILEIIGHTALNVASGMVNLVAGTEIESP